MNNKKQIDDRFNKFGRVSFTAITKVNDFVDHLEAEKVAGTRCKDCGFCFFPPRADCHHCLTSNMEWFDVDGTGNVIGQIDHLSAIPITRQTGGNGV